MFLTRGAQNYARIPAAGHPERLQSLGESATAVAQDQNSIPLLGSSVSEQVFPNPATTAIVVSIFFSIIPI